MATQNSRTFHWQYDELDDDDFLMEGYTFFIVVILSSFIVLLTLFYLYVRWICRTSSVSPHAPPQQGLDSGAIDSLPITLHHRKSTSSLAPESQEECSICLGVFEEGEKVKVLPRCSHSYHCDCVDTWLVTHSSCPICRTSVLVDSVV